MRPGAAVEIPQHRPAPVELRVRRRLAAELGAKGDRVGLRQAGEVARAHGVGQAGHARVGVLRQSPERALHAREEQEQHQRRRHGVREQQPRAAQVGLRRAVRRAEADQRGGEREQRRAHQRGGRDGLGVEEVGDDRGSSRGTPASAASRCVRVSSSFRPANSTSSTMPGPAAEERAVLQPDAEHADRDDAEHQPARRQRRAVERVPEAPAEQAQREHGEPPRARAARAARRPARASRSATRGRARRRRGALGAQRMRRGAHASSPAGTARAPAGRRCGARRRAPGAISTPGRRSP